MSEFNKTLVFAYRANIERYQRLLRTQLADNERAFIERRIADDRQALKEIMQRMGAADRSSAA